MTADTTAPTRINRGAMRRGLVRWELILLLLLIATFVFGAATSAHFLTNSTLFNIGVNIGEIAIMALPLTLIIITGEIDLSVASMLGLSSTLLGYLFIHGWNIWLAVIGVLVVGAVGGALNGILVTRVGLPSIAVTIGTLTLFRGIAEIILKDQSAGGYPSSLTTIGVKPVPHTPLPYSVLFFLVLAAVFAVVLHGTSVGRSIYAIGLQEEAAYFSGIRVKRIKLTLFVLAGLISAFAGVLWTFRFATSRYDAGSGLELNVVAVALLGGVSIFGGRGTILGVVLSAAVVSTFLTALTSINVSAQIQNIVTGGLLLLSVVVPNGADAFRRARAWLRTRSGTPVAPAVAAHQLGVPTVAASGRAGAVAADLGDAVGTPAGGDAATPQATNAPARSTADSTHVQEQ
jgi:rhamnose transport system permease protein